MATYACKKYDTRSSLLYVALAQIYLARSTCANICSALPACAHVCVNVCIIADSVKVKGGCAVAIARAQLHVAYVHYLCCFYLCCLFVLHMDMDYAPVV